MQGMGLGKHPQLRDMYFGLCTRVLYIAQTDDSALRVKAERAAQELGLAYEYSLLGYRAFPGFVEQALAGARNSSIAPTEQVIRPR